MALMALMAFSGVQVLVIRWTKGGHLDTSALLASSYWLVKIFCQKAAVA
jgi:hypothetical protein